MKHIFTKLPFDVSAYPIAEILPSMLQSLESHNTVVVEAPPGTGKSTVLPLALLCAPYMVGKKIFILEPRRLAAKAVANRMAFLLGEKIAETIGYRVRFERFVGPSTRIEVLTEALLTKEIQKDPSLEGVGAIVFDEFHERNLQSDLGLALARLVQTVLREDLKIILMSATIDAKDLSLQLNAPVFSARAKAHELELHYASIEPKNLLFTTVHTILHALNKHDGDVLVFLPGTGEIKKVLQSLEQEFNQLGNGQSEFYKNIVVLPLYGDLSLEEQTRALLADSFGRRKVVLSTSLAETSLTVEGVRVVIDTGLVRLPSFDSRTGLTKLITKRLTVDTATQRAGRAARIGPGVAYRLWTEASHANLIAARKPEILDADLAQLVLELAAWGEENLLWITPPPQSALLQSKELLQSLGATLNNTITERGKKLLRFATHPRIANMLLDEHQAALATDLAAILEERDFLNSVGTDVVLRVQALREWRANNKNSFGTDVGSLKRLERIAFQHRKILNIQVNNHMPEVEEVGRLIALAYPDRVAQLRTGEFRRFKLANGRGVVLPDGDALMGKKYLAVAQLDAGNTEGKIFLAAEINEKVLQQKANVVELAEWNQQTAAFVSKRERRFGQLVLHSEPTRDVPVSLQVGAILEVVRASNLAMLEFSAAVKQFLARVQSLKSWRPEFQLPDFSDVGLLLHLENWLGPHLEHVRRQEDLLKLDYENILQNYSPYVSQQTLNKLAPKTLEVPSGSKIKLQYFDDASSPVLAVRLQEMFGQLLTPTINDGRTTVLVHLLSPGFKPVQITQDLHSFWHNAYFEVRKDLRQRYPKHAWPEDPLTARAVRGAKRKT